MTVVRGHVLYCESGRSVNVLYCDSGDCMFCGVTVVKVYVFCIVIVVRVYVLYSDSDKSARFYCDSGTCTCFVL